MSFLQLNEGCHIVEQNQQTLLSVVEDLVHLKSYVLDLGASVLVGSLNMHTENVHGDAVDITKLGSSLIRVFTAKKYVTY